MKHKIQFTAAIGVIVVIGLLLAGCAGMRIERLSGAEFMTQAKYVSLVESFQWTRYIGSTGQRAYLEYGHPAFIGSGIRTTVYWTPLSELPSNVVRQIETGTPLWTNWTSRVNTEH